MASVAILVNPVRTDAARLASQISEWLERRHDEAYVLRLPPADRAEGKIPAGELQHVDLSGADLAISLGGDGTFLRLVPLAYRARVRVLGVNFGRLGYLLEVEPERVFDALESALSGDAPVDDRLVLAVTVPGGLTQARGDDRSLEGDGVVCAQGERWWVALNEMVVEKTVPGHMVSLETALDGQELLTYKADGVLVASPTGSTAYNLSAGGPILAPSIPAMVMTPVAPHLAIDRSVVLRADQQASVRVLPPRPAVLVVDGREAGRLSPGAEVVCRVAPGCLRMVSTGDRVFARRLRHALTQGVQE